LARLNGAKLFSEPIAVGDLQVQQLLELRKQLARRPCFKVGQFELFDVGLLSADRFLGVRDPLLDSGEVFFPEGAVGRLEHSLWPLDRNP
jgi:hypothetical protein